MLKRTNFRSKRLLDRLGFVLASQAEAEQHPVEPDEWLMSLDVGPAVRMAPDGRVLEPAPATSGTRS